ncbi:MAG TPA: rhodanese-like domain-containing protein [Chitinophagaceae bacterium]
MEIKNNATIVDVRTPEEFVESHFPNAINIPLDQVQQRINEFIKMPKPIITYCRSGARSGMAMSFLTQSGIAEVQNGGGLEDMLQQNKIR